VDKEEVWVHFHSFLSTKTMSRKRVNLDKFEEKLQNGEYYEAHQSLKAIFARLVKQGQPEEAFEAIARGAAGLNDHGRHSSATDLAIQLLAVFIERKTVPDDITRGLVMEVLQGCPPSEPSRSKLLDSIQRQFFFISS